MNIAEPIKDIEVVRSIAETLKKRSERDYILFLFGIYSGISISDILKFKVQDVRNKKQVLIKEHKTGNKISVPINRELKNVLERYIATKDDYDFLFKSRQGNNKPISRQQAWKTLKKVGTEFGINNMGTHTLKKTFGYHLYKQTGDIALVQKMLNFPTREHVYRYIGEVQEETENSILKLSYSRQKRNK